MFNCPAVKFPAYRRFAGGPVLMPNTRPSCPLAVKSNKAPLTRTLSSTNIGLVTSESCTVHADSRPLRDLCYTRLGSCTTHVMGLCDWTIYCTSLFAAAFAKAFPKAPKQPRGSRRVAGELTPIKMSKILCMIPNRGMLRGNKRPQYRYLKRRAVDILAEGRLHDSSLTQAKSLAGHSY